LPRHTAVDGTRNCSDGMAIAVSTEDDEVESSSSASSQHSKQNQQKRKDAAVVRVTMEYYNAVPKGVVWWALSSGYGHPSPNHLSNSNSNSTLSAAVNNIGGAADLFSKSSRHGSRDDSNHGKSAELERPTQADVVPSSSEAPTIRMIAIITITSTLTKQTARP
jgi:hypothetical protein